MKNIVEEVADTLNVEPEVVIIMATKLMCFQHEETIQQNNLERYQKTGYIPAYVIAFCKRVMVRV